MAIETVDSIFTGPLFFIAAILEIRGGYLVWLWIREKKTIAFTTLGGIGVSAITFLANNQIPLRLVSILLLIYAYYSISNKLTKNCAINYNKKKDKVYD